MNWRLPPEISFCETGQDTVFLDLRRDRYFRLTECDRASFEALRAGASVSQAELSRLFGAGILCDNITGGALEPVSISVPRRSLIESDPGGSDWRGPLRTSWSLVQAARAVRPVALGRTIHALRRRKQNLARSNHASEEAMLHEARAFSTWRRWVPIKPVCLLDSVALFDVLLDRGLSATLVFGVRSRPFAAHCWVQSDRHILSEAVDRAHNFTPILAV